MVSTRWRSARWYSVHQLYIISIIILLCINNYYIIPICALTDYILLCSIIAQHSTATALIDVIVQRLTYVFIVLYTRAGTTRR